MSLDTRYSMIDNFIYLYHTNEVIVIPTFADSITDSLHANFSQETPLTRSAPIYSYQNSGPRSLQVMFDLHRELMYEVNYKVSNIKPDAGDDYVDYMIKAVQAAALPEYSMALKMVNPPVIALKLGNDIFIKGVVTGDVGVTYGYPIIPGRKPDGSIDESQSKYASVKIGFGINEVDPYQASDVMREGSFRGVPKTLERFVYGDMLINNIVKNSARSSSGGSFVNFAGKSSGFMTRMEK